MAQPTFSAGFSHKERNDWVHVAIFPAAREYDSFGNLIANSSTGTWPGRLGYQGQAWMEFGSENASQRLLLSPTRIFDPGTGRFLQADLGKYQAGRPGANHYVYADSNPHLFVDFDGAQNQPVTQPTAGQGNIADYGGVLGPSPESTLPSLIDPDAPGSSSTASDVANNALKSQILGAIDQLKNLENLEVVVRRLATHDMVQDALKKCDIIYINAHGHQYGPKHLSLYDTYKPGVPPIDWTKNMGTGLQSCTLAACEGSRIANDLNKATKDKVTFVGYTYDQVGLNLISRKFLDDLKELGKTFKGCPKKDKKPKVCILFGQAGRTVGF